MGCCPCYGKHSRKSHQRVISNVNQFESEGNDDGRNPAPKVFIQSKYSLADILKSDITPSSTQKQFMLFNCPICLRFFSLILQTQCCRNYICHFCVDELQNRDLNFDVACPHCKSEPVHVVDVDLASTVKNYSDSPFGTAKFDGSHQNRWIPNLPVVDEDGMENPNVQSMILEEAPAASDDHMFNTA